MKLKKLEIYGFKSFADKLELNFEDGITAVVGPNGCGKSNVADAIRWVMGEQSAKLLRGSSMQDVIFNGSELRKSLSYCEVSLHFDNMGEENSSDLAYNEIVITRKLYRSGESEYLINRSQSQLKNITEFLRKANIGREGYSIIGQGRVEQLISAKPEERRAIFDEATGVSGFKANKQDSERKLQRARENLARFNDIITEIERQLGPLSQQADIAKQYNELREQLRYHEINNFIYNHETASQQKAKIMTKIKGLEEELNLNKSSYNEVESLYKKKMGEINDIDKTIADLHESQLVMSVSKTQQEGQELLFKQKAEFVKAQNYRIQEEIKNLQADLDKKSDQLQTLNEKLFVQHGNLDKFKKTEEQLSSEILDVVARITAIEDDVENVKNEVFNSISRLSDIKIDSNRLEVEKSSLAQSQKEVLKNIIESNKKIEETKQEKDRVQAFLVELKEKTSETHREKDIISKALDELKKIEYSFLEEVNEIKKNKAHLIGKRDFLAQMKDSFDGFSNSVKRLLVDAKENQKISSHICGVVANLIKTPQKYEVAIEASLNNNLQNVVTNNLEDVKYVINYIKEKRYGLITFMPIESMKLRNFNETAALKEKGVVGIAKDLISYDKKYESIFSSLLGNTVLTEDLDTAVFLAKKYRNAFKIVTLDGEVFNTSGIVTGGNKKNQIANVLSHDREIEQIDKKLGDIERELSQKEAEREKAEANFLQKSSQFDETLLKLNLQNIEIAKTTELLSKVDYVLNEEETRCKKFSAENTAIEERLKLIDVRLNEVNSKETDVNLKKRAHEEKMQDNQIVYDELKNKKNELTDLHVNAKLERTKAEADVQSVFDEIRRLNLAKDDIEKTISNNKRLIDDNNEEIKKLEDSVNELISKHIGVEEINVVKAKLLDLDKFKEEMKKEVEDLDVKRNELSIVLNKISSKINIETVDLNKVDVDIEMMKDKIWEDYQCTVESALRQKDEAYVVSKSASAIKNVKKKITDLGSVNLAAIDDYNNLKKRYDDMVLQRDDVKKAEIDLCEIIADLSTRMKEIFSKGFAKINEYFNVTFKELFGGGNAKLTLVPNEENDPLTMGVDIEAEPPGKTLQNLTLLSGGEKSITAIAILFAIIKLRPMPFCVLDEIEAALDDANTVRFAKYLQKFAKYTQFIVITHKKPTMQLADAMYGVTMQEKGVSKLVSVKLSEIE